MEYYGPRYKLEVLANNADDHNPPEYLEKIKCVSTRPDSSEGELKFRQTILEGLKDLPFAPGAQMKGIPNKSLGAILGIGSSGLNDPEDDVEAAVHSESRCNRSLERALIILSELLRRRNGYTTESSDDEDLEDVPSASRSRRQGGRSARPAPAAKRRDVDMEIDEDDDDPCRVKKRTFFSSKGGVRSNLPKVLVNGSSSTNGASLRNKGIIDWGTSVNGNGNGNGSVSRAASPMSVV
jgi:histone deacetylase 1/2